MKIQEFIKLHGAGGDKSWIGYNESIILPNKTIIEAVPSHERAIADYVCDLKGISFSELSNSIPTYISPVHFLIEKYKICSIWYYEAIIYPDAFKNSRKLVHIFNELIKANLLSPDIWDSITIAHEATYLDFCNNEITYEEYKAFLDHNIEESNIIKGGKYKNERRKYYIGTRARARNA